MSSSSDNPKPRPPNTPRGSRATHRPPVRTTRHVNPRAAIEATLNIDHLKTDIRNFRVKWAAIRLIESDDLKTAKVWADMFPSYKDVPTDTLTYLDACNKKRPLYRFRKELSEFIVSAICTHPITCESYGSSAASSDIDVTITARINHVHESLTTYVKICKFLRELFLDDPLFAGSLRNVFHFFDINYYLSNFAIKKDDNAPDDRLSSYIISRAYSGKARHDINNQYYYAFVDMSQKQKRDASNDDELYINRYNQFSIMIERLKAGETDPSHVIDILSTISTFEDECYHTQGAFFHVVMMMQRKIKFKDIEENKEVFVKMLYASALENLVFAYTHFDIPSKRNKYLIRYMDAYNRLVQYIPKDSISIDPINIGSDIKKTFIANRVQRYMSIFARRKDTSVALGR